VLSSTLEALLAQIAKDHFYLMHLCYGHDISSRQPLWEYASRHGLIGLDYGDPNVDKKWDKFPGSEKKRLTSKWRRQFDLFSTMEKGDCVVIMSGKTHLLGVGLVRDPYVFKARLRSKFFRHIRPVKWLIRYRWRDRLPFRVSAFLNTLIYVDENSSYWKVVSRKLSLQRGIPHETEYHARREKKQLQQKYGGGEGKEHRKLKNWVYSHPDKVGVSDILRKHEEYEFLSGDRADIVFDLQGNRYTVVEIETNNPTPGVHQALKYKVLKCAELGLDLKSPDVEALLVAWRKPDDLRFCRKYGVRFTKRRV
jgi:hypothetical protein